MIAPFITALPDQSVHADRAELVDLVVVDIFELLRQHGIDVEITDAVLIRAEIGARVLLDGLGVLHRPLVETIVPVGGVL
jgi:hypothetical protein